MEALVQKWGIHGEEEEEEGEKKEKKKRIGGRQRLVMYNIALRTRAWMFKKRRGPSFYVGATCSQVAGPPSSQCK